MGGRLDVLGNDVVVFDAKGSDGYYDVYIQNLDGTNKECLTRQKAELPQKHNGQPSFYPSGEYIVFQSIDPELEGMLKIRLEQEVVLTGPEQA